MTLEKTLQVFVLRSHRLYEPPLAFNRISRYLLSVYVDKKPVRVLSRQCRCQCEQYNIMIRESVPLLFKDVNSDLSLFFSTLCIIDIFGVFPIIALPSAIVQCGEFLLISFLRHEQFLCTRYSFEMFLQKEIIN